ncbi:MULTISPECIES: hypothetical protein [unclassified Bartonella]|uniref:hypothetical protein n=1 Tax=unclassified Bartonella TaxID=2645622 RepID=UPI0035CE9453
MHEFAHLAIVSPFFDSVQQLLALYFLALQRDFSSAIFQAFAKPLKHERFIEKLLLEYFLTEGAQSTYRVCFHE